MRWPFRAVASEKPRPPLPSEQDIQEETAYPAGTLEDFYWGRPVSGTEEDYLWRRLSDNWYQKDVIPSTYLELHNQCYEAYNSNPLARQAIEITTSMVLGSGLRVVARGQRVQRLLDRFWHDPDNHMDLRVYSLCTELALYGEQFIRFFVNPIDGAVKIGQIDPSTIDQIVTDPENVEKPLRFHQRPVGPGFDVWDSGSETLEMSRERTAGDAPEGRWFEAGTEVVQFAINKVSNAKRGQSDLATMLVWLRRYKDWLTDRVRLNKYKGAFLWDVKLNGADKKTIDRKKMEYAYPPLPGSLVVHNETEEWTAVEPRIGADQVEADGKAIKMMVAVGAGLPEHYLAEGGNVNKATAAEMGLPTLKRFERRQDYVGFMLRSILDRVLLEAERAGLLSARVDRRYDIIFPPIDVDDGEGIASAMSKLVPALVSAREAGWLTDGTAMKLLHRFLGGDAFDVTEERQ
ncbi:MAG TPA: hypothetical protein VK009_00505 [Chloroflexota bacterium]|nr:hypothetical protein [Chloroflexota bacterium]